MGISNITAGGTWGISLQWNGFSFIDKLRHGASVTWVGGTNHKNSIVTTATPGPNNHLRPGTYLTAKDSLIELNLNNTYEIYQNLSAVLNFAYIIENFDGDNWGRAYGLNGEARFSDVFRTGLSFVYNF
jgi:hypothetical protein